MAIVRLSIAAAVVCFLFQCVDSGSVGSLRTNGLSKRFRGGPAGNLTLPTIDVGVLNDNMVLPAFDGKQDKPLKVKLFNIANLKLAFIKQKLANIGSLKPTSKSHFKGAGKLFHKMNQNNPIILGKIGNGKFSKGRSLLGSKGLFKEASRQGLADKLGLGNSFQFFDSRRIFDSTSNIFGPNNNVNPLDMLDIKLANLNARFQKNVGNLSPDMSRLNEKLDVKLASVNIADIGKNLGPKLKLITGNGKFDGKFVQFGRKLNLIDELDGKLSSLNFGSRLSGGGKFNPIDFLDGKLFSIRN